MPLAPERCARRRATGTDDPVGPGSYARVGIRFIGFNVN